MPDHVGQETALSVISIVKYVDGFHPVNIGRVAIRGRIHARMRAALHSLNTGRSHPDPQERRCRDLPESGGRARVQEKSCHTLRTASHALERDNDRGARPHRKALGDGAAGEKKRGGRVEGGDGPGGVVQAGVFGC